MDIGTTVLAKNEYFHIQNFNTIGVSFKGGRVIDLEKWKEKWSEDLIKIKEIHQYYIEMGLSDYDFQIDSFYYHENGKSHFYPLVEVNCRKSLGLFVYSLK